MWLRRDRIGVATPAVHAIGLAALFGLSACNPFGWGPDDTERSLPFRANIAVAENRQDLAISIEAPPGTPVEVVRETARYQATRYCLQWYGDSDASWQTDPATGDWAFTRTPEAMIFRAECEGR